MKEHEHYLSVIKFPAFVSIVLIILSGVYFAFIYQALQKPGLTPSQSLIYGLLLLALLFLVVNWVLTLISTHTRIRPAGLRRLNQWLLTHVYYGLARGLAAITFSDRCGFIESYLNFNNEIVLTDQRDIHNTRILLLLPHCLQKEDCGVRISSDIINCAECGGCAIASLKQLATAQQISAVVASVGALARKLIADKQPEVIVSVACHRDLVDTLRDAWHYPVYGVLNERPGGPCQEAAIDLAVIEFAIQRFK